MKKALWIVLISLLTLGLLAGCAAPAAESDPAKVRIGTQPWIGYGPWWIAEKQGLFEKYNLDVELVDFVEDKEVNAAFASGEMEAANLATHTAIKLYSAGVGLNLVLLEDVSTSADAILGGANIASVADLKGQSVAYEEGTTSDLLLNYALSQNGMTLADITPVPMPASDAGTSLITGNVPAAVTYEPYVSEALMQSADAKIIYEAGERPGLGIAGDRQRRRPVAGVGRRGPGEPRRLGFRRRSGSQLPAQRRYVPLPGRGAAERRGFAGLRARTAHRTTRRAPDRDRHFTTTDGVVLTATPRM